MIEPVLDARTVDRMVDGELSPDEERSLLLQLEDQPDGWRQLALAFVEHRVWRREFLVGAAGSARGEFLAGAAGLGPGWRRAAVGPAGRSSRAAGGARATALRRSAVVLLVVLAFASGLAAGRSSFGRAGLWERQAVRPDSRSPREATGGDPSTFAPGEQMTSAEVSGAGRSAPREQTTLRVVFEEPESGEAVPMDVPLVEAAQLGLDWPGPAPALSDDLRQRLEETGHSILETRHWYPVQLNDGRQVLLPVDHVQVQYAADRIYQ